jgi:hypothetical protein
MHNFSIGTLLFKFKALKKLQQVQCMFFSPHFSNKTKENVKMLWGGGGKISRNAFEKYAITMNI